MPQSSQYYKSQKSGDAIMRRFEFTKVFRQHITQENIFDEIVKPRVFHFINGKNSTLVAYGTTGSGTYNILATFYIVM